MKVANVLLTISNIAKDNGLSKPYICGGLPRDKVLDRKGDFTDIDITTGNSDIVKLAELCSFRITGPNIFFKTMKDGHSTLFIDDLKVDFSSNFNAPNINQLLNQSGFGKPNSMQLELYSRDFTCNALLMTFDLKKVLDPTGLGVNDIKNKLIKTCLPAKFTLSQDNKRIIRVIYMACKLGFNVDEEIIDWVSENPQFVSNCSQQYLIKKLKKSLIYNKGYTIELINKMNLLNYLPPIPELMPTMQSSI